MGYIDDYTYETEDYVYGYAPNREGWFVKPVKDKSKSNYEPLLSHIEFQGVSKPVVYLSNTYRGCSELINMPVLPNTIIDQSYTFDGCIKLSNLEELPENLETLNGMFRNCSSIIFPPEIPENATDINRCFSGCTALEEAPIIPQSVTSLDYAFEYTAITEPPILHPDVERIGYAFRGCSKLEYAPTIPNGVTYMPFCFDGCTSISAAPVIPASVTHMRYCFYGCTNLEGNVIVYNEPYDGKYAPFDNVFRNTKKEIYIVNRGNEKEGKILWRREAGQYANVHYEADDAIAPVITDFKAIRVDASGDTTPNPTGLYAYVTAKLTTYETNIPVGWTNEVKTGILTDNGSTESPTWYSQSGTDPLEVWCWISLGDTATHELSLQIIDSIKEESIEKKSQQSQVVYASILKSYALVDYYHDETASGVTEGMAIGKYAEHADLLDIDMPVMFRQKTNLGLAPIGSIIQYAGTVEPDGWLICNGRALSRATYADLFDAIGTTYGAGDGSSTFNIPDLRGRTAIGVSTDHALGSSGGEEEHTLTVDEMPRHGHNAYTWVYAGTTGPAKGITNNGADWYDVQYGNQLANGSWKTSSFQAAQNGYGDPTGPTDMQGGGQAHNNMQPYLTCNYIIKWKNVLASGSAITVQEMADLLRPIGTVYETEDADFDPNTSWGGTWEVVAESIVVDTTKKVVNGTIDKNRYSRAVITAPTVDGYEFDHWGDYGTDGWLSSLYPESAASATTNLWNNITDGSGMGQFHIYAYYVKKETVYRWKRTA